MTTDGTEPQPGKRYTCEICGGQVICTKGGEGSLACCGAPMTALEPKPMPSAD
jgi:hypothetical protein